MNQYPVCNGLKPQLSSQRRPAYVSVWKSAFAGGAQLSTTDSSAWKRLQAFWTNQAGRAAPKMSVNVGQTLEYEAFNHGYQQIGIIQCLDWLLTSEYWPLDAEVRMITRFILSLRRQMLHYAE